jgi:hypothetical protein
LTSRVLLQQLSSCVGSSSNSCDAATPATFRPWSFRGPLIRFPARGHVLVGEPFACGAFAIGASRNTIGHGHVVADRMPLRCLSWGPCYPRTQDWAPASSERRFSQRN